MVRTMNQLPSQTHTSLLSNRAVQHNPPAEGTGEMHRSSNASKRLAPQTLAISHGAARCPVSFPSQISDPLPIMMEFYIP